MRPTRFGFKILPILALLLLADRAPVVIADDRQSIDAWRESWPIQENAISTAVIKFRLYRSPSLGGLVPYSEDTLKRAIETALPTSDSPADLDLVSRTFLGKPFAELPPAKFVFDGERTLEEFAGDKQIVDAGMHAVVEGANQAILLQDKAVARQRVVHLRDFRFLPSVKLFDVATVSPDSGLPASLMALKYVGGDRDLNEYKIHRASGNVIEYKLTHPDGAIGTWILQADFRVLSGGAQMPFVKILVNYGSAGEPRSVEAILVESMDVNVDVPRETFAIAGGAGHLVYDLRGREGLPGRSHRLTQNEADVVSVVKERDAEVAAQLAPISPKGRRGSIGTIIAMNAAAIAAIFVFVVYRKRVAQKT